MSQDLFEGSEYERQRVAVHVSIDEQYTQLEPTTTPAMTYLYRDASRLDDSQTWELAAFLPRVDEFLSSESERGWFEEQRRALGLTSTPPS